MQSILLSYAEARSSQIIDIIIFLMGAYIRKMPPKKTASRFSQQVKRPASMVAKVKRLTKDLKTIQRGGGFLNFITRGWK